MYYVYYEETGEELMLEDKSDAIDHAKALIKDMMIDGDVSGEVLILEPTMVVRGEADITFEVETFKKEEDTNDKDLSVTESSTTKD